MSRKPLNVVLKDLLKKFRRKDRGHIFWEAVPKTIPGYYEQVKEPMDFSLMESKMKKLRYTTLDDFSRDYLLVVHNAKYFNHPDSEYWEQADMMEKYGVECIELARDTIDPSLPVNAKWTGVDEANATAAAAAAGGGQVGGPTNPYGMTNMQGQPGPAQPGAPFIDIAALQAKQKLLNNQPGGIGPTGAPTTASGALAAQPFFVAPPVRPGARAAQIQQSSSLFDNVSQGPQSIYNSNLYPHIPIGFVQSHGFAHPASLPESTSYFTGQPYPTAHPQSGMGIAQAQQAFMGANMTMLVGKGKQKNQQIKPVGTLRGKRDIRNITGPGIENNFGMGLIPTPMDWITVWEREQEVWKQTGKNAIMREEQDGYNSLGPLGYGEYKPSSHYSFDQRYLDRIQKFVKLHVIGDAAALPSTSTMTQQPNLNIGQHSNVYSHLLKESSIHRALQSKVESISSDSSLQFKASSKDFIPSPLAIGLPKQHPVALKPGEPMGISAQDVAQIKHLMGELEGMMKQAFVLKTQGGQAGKKVEANANAAATAASTSVHQSSPAPTATAAAGDTSAPMDVDTPAATKTESIKAEPSVKLEPGVKTEQPGVKVENEPTSAPMDTSEGSASAPVTVKQETASPSLALPSPWTPPNLIAALPVLPTQRIVVLDVQFVSLSSGSADTRVVFRFAPSFQTVAPNFTAEFLAQSLSQQDILALRGMQNMCERMTEWHRQKHGLLRQQQQQQALRQQQAAAAAAQAQQDGGHPMTDISKGVPPQQHTGKHAPSGLPPGEEPQAKRMKLGPSISNVSGTQPSPLTPAQQQQQLLAAQKQQQMAQQQQQHAQQQQQHRSSRSSLSAEEQQKQLLQMQYLKQQQLAAQQPHGSSSNTSSAVPAGASTQPAPPAPSSVSPSSVTPSSANASLGPSSHPSFDRARLIPALRGLNPAMLDRLIEMRYISPTGSVLVDTQTIIAKMREIQQQQSLQRTPSTPGTPQQQTQQQMQTSQQQPPLSLQQ